MRYHLLKRRFKKIIIKKLKQVRNHLLKRWFSKKKIYMSKILTKKNWKIVSWKFNFHTKVIKKKTPVGSTKVRREYFGLSKLEKGHPDKLFIYIGNALNASVRNGFSGILVDLFCKGSLISELQDPGTWEKLRKRLRKGGRIMVNVGGSCVEAEDSRRDGKVAMEESLKAMHKVFGDQFLFWISERGRRIAPLLSPENCPILTNGRKLFLDL